MGLMNYGCIFSKLNILMSPFIEQEKLGKALRLGQVYSVERGYLKSNGYGG